MATDNKRALEIAQTIQRHGSGEIEDQDIDFLVNYLIQHGPTNAVLGLDVDRHRINASKENARLARQHLLKLSQGWVGDDPDEYTFLYSFLEAAERKLPHEASYLRAADRQRAKGAK